MMKRTILAATLAIIIIFLILIALLWQPWTPPNRALIIAATSPDGLGQFRQYFPDYHPGPEAPVLQEVNSTGRFLSFGYCNIACYKVPFTSVSGIVGVYDFALVDLNNGRVMAWDTCDYRGTPAAGHASLPPGACWYHEIAGSINITCEPANATLQYLVLNYPDLLGSMSGGTYNETSFEANGKQVTPGAARQLESGTAIVPSDPGNRRYILIRSLETKREIELSYIIMPH